VEEALYASLWIWVKDQSDAAIAHGGDYSLVTCLSLNLDGLRVSNVCTAIFGSK
jgi:hypothetical protein